MPVFTLLYRSLPLYFYISRLNVMFRDWKHLIPPVRYLHIRFGTRFICSFHLQKYPLKLLIEVCFIYIYTYICIYIYLHIYKYIYIYIYKYVLLLNQRCHSMWAQAIFVCWNIINLAGIHRLSCHVRWQSKCTVVTSQLWYNFQTPWILPLSFETWSHLHTY